MRKFDIHNKLSKKQQKAVRSYLRAAIQILFFLAMPSAFTASFAGVKYIFTQVGHGDRIEMTSFVIILLSLCMFTILFGRFFCGFACAFGSLGDAIHKIYVTVCRKRKKRPAQLRSDMTKRLTVVKYLVLAVIVLMCFGGIYESIQGTSPWDVFSMIQAGKFKFDGYIPGAILLILLIVGMAVQERFFCRFLCPMGAVFALLPALPAFSLYRNREGCIKNCSACTKMCPARLELAEEGAFEISGDCFQCQKCIGVCPRSNIHCGIRTVKGNEIIFTVIRAILLFVLFLWIGI